VTSIYANHVDGPSTIDAVVDGIPGLIAEHPDDDGLAEALFRDFNCFYSPKALGQSTREWLLHVAATVKAQQASVEQSAAEKGATEDLDDDGES